MAKWKYLTEAVSRPRGLAASEPSVFGVQGPRARSAIGPLLLKFNVLFDRIHKVYGYWSTHGTAVLGQHIVQKLMFKLRFPLFNA